MLAEQDYCIKGKVPFNIFARAGGFPKYMEKKNDLLYLIFIQGCPSLMKINVGFYIKKLFWQLSSGEGYKEKKLKKSQKQKKNVTVFPAWLFHTEQHVISSSQLNKTF